MSETAEVIQLHKGNGGRKDLYEMGEIPPMGHLPSKMYAWAIRHCASGMARRLGEQSMQVEVVPTPDPRLPTRWSSS